MQQTMRQLMLSTAVAAILATVFTAWTPASLNPGELARQLMEAFSSTDPAAEQLAWASPTESGPLRVGIVAGHSGLNPETGYVDPGSVCPDGLTELQVNESIAHATVNALLSAGFRVDLFEEFDPRLEDYRAVALISIHADSCMPINELATGFKVAAAQDTTVPDRAQRLATCLSNRYSSKTELTFHAGSITRDMTNYHTFYEIDPLTPAVIIETGFLFLDRDFLTQKPEIAARGILDGVMCYVNNEPINVLGE